MKNYYSLANLTTGPASNLFQVTPEKRCEDPYLKNFPCATQRPPHLAPSQPSNRAPAPLGVDDVDCHRFTKEQLATYNCMRPGFNGRPVHFTYSRLSDDNWCSSETCGSLNVTDLKVL
ncbi:MAG: hypothetical protein K0U52_12660 [Gammaproteobacteria bacterium]|nr:hypothetical protein [Gammaproteobacteria bacterium]